jgi:hypothetical protein
VIQPSGSSVPECFASVFAASRPKGAGLCRDRRRLAARPAALSGRHSTQKRRLVTPSIISRRLFLQLLAVAAATENALSGTHFPEGVRPEVLLDLPRSANFRLKADGTPIAAGSLYRESTEHRSELSFDVSNNQISASLTRQGEIRRACICSGVEPLPLEKIKGGVYCTKRLLYGGPWFLRATIDSADFNFRHGSSPFCLSSGYSSSSQLCSC